MLFCKFQLRAQNLPVKGSAVWPNAICCKLYQFYPGKAVPERTIEWDHQLVVLRPWVWRQVVVPTVAAVPNIAQDCPISIRWTHRSESQVAWPFVSLQSDIVPRRKSWNSLRTYGQISLVIIIMILSLHYIENTNLGATNGNDFNCSQHAFG